MKVKAEQRIQQVFDQTDDIIRQIDSQGRQFLDAAARIGVNNSKDAGRADTWTDRTGNLRNSIGHFLTKERDQFGEGEIAVVFAGMEYAAFVHFRDGYRVLVEPAENQIKPLIKKLSL